MKTNDIRLVIEVDGELCGHFKLSEFAGAEGLVCLHPSVLVGLERLRRDLGKLAGEEVVIVVTCGTRTDRENLLLGERLGWTDEGGQVSRMSKHLPRYGGIAVDFKAWTKAGPGEKAVQIEQKTLGRLARLHFDWVKDDYADGHVHADQRTRAN